MNYVDCHCHPLDKKIYDKIDEVILNSNNAGIKYLLACSASSNQWSYLTKLSKKYDQVIPGFGIHPWYVDQAGDNWLYELKKSVDDFKGRFLFIGEVGLDSKIQIDMKLQQEFFEKQFELAKSKNLFVNIHCRGAWQYLIESLNKVVGAGKEYTPGFVIHAFSGPENLINKLVNYGAYFSFARAKEIIKQIPSERLLLETDAPDMLAFPENIVDVVKNVALALNISEQNVCDIISKNIGRIFNGLKI